MESTYTDLALSGGKNLCSRTYNGFSPYLRSAMVRFPLQFLCTISRLKNVTHLQSTSNKKVDTNRRVEDFLLLKLMLTCKGKSGSKII